MIPVSSLPSDEEIEEEIDTSLLLDTKNIDEVEKQDSENYTSNPYMIVDDKPYIIDLIRKSLSLCKYRLIAIGTSMSIWLILLISGIVLLVIYQNQCSSVARWSKFTLCVLGYMFLTYLGIFSIELYIWIKVKRRITVSQEENIKTPELVRKMTRNESLIDLLRIGNRINDITVRRKTIKDICADNNGKHSFNQFVIHDKHFMIKAIKKAIKLSTSTVPRITAPNKKELYNRPFEDLVNKYFFMWIGIPILLIVIWTGIATNIDSTIYNENNKQSLNDLFQVKNITNFLHIYIKTNGDCSSLYIFNIIMMVIVSLQTVASFIPFFIRLLWTW